MEKINQVVTYISTNNITYELIYVGAKIVWENWDPLKKHEEKSKPEWEIRLETQINKNLRKQTKMIKQKKDVGTCREKKEKATQETITIQLEEINQKVLSK